MAPPTLVRLQQWGKGQVKSVKLEFQRRLRLLLHASAKRLHLPSVRAAGVSSLRTVCRCCKAESAGALCRGGGGSWCV